MSQGHRISQYQEIEELLERVRQAHEADEAAQPAAAGVSDRVERSRKNPFSSVPGVDLHKQMTQNLEMAPANPERFGNTRGGSGRVVVKAEARASDYQGLPPRAETSEAVAAEDPAETSLAPIAAGEAGTASTGEGEQQATAASDDMPEWQRTERALEEAVDYNEDVLLPAAKCPLTRATTTQSAAAGASSDASSSKSSAMVADLQAVFANGLTDHERAFHAAVQAESPPAMREPQAPSGRNDRASIPRPEREPTRHGEATTIAFENGHSREGRLIAELVKEVAVQSGEGASFEDRNRTQTFVPIPHRTGRKG